MTPKLPVLFLGHGSPMNAINGNIFYEEFTEIAKTFPKPTAILCISAHWTIENTSITSSEAPEIIYDFYGFPAELYNIDYKAKGNPYLAKKIQDTLLDIEYIKLEDKNWGLDHGSWMPIRHMYPDADVPILQMSINVNYLHDKNGREKAFQIGQKLQSLRQEGVLIIGSGDIVHNLRKADFKNIDTPDTGYIECIEFQKEIDNLIIKKDFDSLFNYLEINKKYNNLPFETSEHFFPVFYILGATDKDDELKIFNNTLMGGTLSMTSYIFG